MRGVFCIVLYRGHVSIVKTSLSGVLISISPPSLISTGFSFSRRRIVEDGTHAELLARRGAYHQLWSRQSGGLLPDLGDDADADRAVLRSAG
jgi:hypothetical protein